MTGQLAKPGAKKRPKPQRAAPNSRPDRVGKLLEDLEARAGEATPERYNALAVLIADAGVSSDEQTLLAAQRGLQRVHAAQRRIADPTAEQLEQRGRILTALDITAWTLRRLTPDVVTRGLEPGGYGHSFLQAIDHDPGLCNGQIADLLHVDDTEISRVGRRLVDAGLARKRRVGRRNQWEITPRGRQALAG